MQSYRMIIILGVVLLVLFGISLALSVRSGQDNRTVPEAAWIDGLKNVFLKDQRLAVQDIKDISPSSCLDREQNAFVIEQGKSCKAEIGESSKVVRKAKLTVEQGGKCAIDFVPADGENALPIHSTTGSVELSIMQKGGTLTIKCTETGVEKSAVVKIE
jgi:hypothetical protein